MPLLRPIFLHVLAVTASLLACKPLVAFAADDAIACGKAEQPDEKAICADPPLVQDDARMAALYAKAMAISGMGERGDLQDAQTAWLEQRRGCKDDAACLGAAYATRIEQLQKVIDAASSRNP